MFKVYYTVKVLTINKKNVKIWLSVMKRMWIYLPGAILSTKLLYNKFVGKFAFFTSGSQGEIAWRMAFCAQRKLCFRFAPCALRFANSPGPPAKTFH
jgi:hypothetical protein